MKKKNKIKMRSHRLREEILYNAKYQKNFRRLDREERYQPDIEDI